MKTIRHFEKYFEETKDVSKREVIDIDSHN